MYEQCVYMIYTCHIVFIGIHCSKTVMKAKTRIDSIPAFDTPIWSRKVWEPSLRPTAASAPAHHSASNVHHLRMPLLR